VVDLDLGVLHQPGFRPFLIRGECSAYWTVYDGAYEPVVLADAYLRRLRLGSGKALGTTATLDRRHRPGRGVHGGAGGGHAVLRVSAAVPAVRWQL
jgi:hypothetical protein